MAESVIRCLFCEQPSKYSCPQCSIRYCSVTCYKDRKHFECSENFYKQQVGKFCMTYRRVFRPVQVVHVEPV